MSSHDHHHDSPEELLEKSLVQAVNDPAQRTLFYRNLLEASVYILADSGLADKGGDLIIAPNHELDIQHWEMQDGLSTIPFFSSLAMLQQAVGDNEQPFMTLPARDLFAMTRGAQLFLNPKCEYGKAFYPQEVEMLLETGGLQAPQEQVTLEGGTLSLGQPQEYPSAVVDALTKLFSERRIVRRAFLAQIHDKSADDVPNLLIGLELEAGDDDAGHLIQETGSIASAALAEDAPVDICLIGETSDGVSHYLTTHTQPFYQRRWGSWLRNSIPSSTLM